ncbi:MAG: hypothetical protein WBB01_26610 [Phormidesmis sp.]
MKGKPRSKREYASSSGALWALRLVKVFLLLLFIGICVVGKRKSTWPIVSWALYSEYSPRFRAPEPAVTVTELRVYTAAGDLRIVKPEHILTLPRDSLSHKIVEQAFNESDVGGRDESRRYLMKAVSNLLGKNSKAESIQAWHLSYPIKPLTVPPIQVGSPATEEMVGSFSAEDLIESD